MSSFQFAIIILAIVGSCAVWAMSLWQHYKASKDWKYRQMAFDVLNLVTALTMALVLIWALFCLWQ